MTCCLRPPLCSATLPVPRPHQERALSGIVCFICDLVAVIFSLPFPTVTGQPYIVLAVPATLSLSVSSTGVMSAALLALPSTSGRHHVHCSGSDAEALRRSAAPHLGAGRRLALGVSGPSQNAPTCSACAVYSNSCSRMREQWDQAYCSAAARCLRWWSVDGPPLHNRL